MYKQAERTKKIRNKLDNLFLKRVGIVHGPFDGLRRNPAHEKEDEGEEVEQ